MSGLTCAVVDSDGVNSGAQGFDYFEGISAQSAGARGLCMHRLEIPPGGSARPHLHEHHETAIYVLQGRAEMGYGEKLGERLEVRAGQLLSSPPVCRICRSIRATARPASRCLRAPTRTSRKASCCSTRTADDSLLAESLRVGRRPCRPGVVDGKPVDRESGHRGGARARWRGDRGGDRRAARARARRRARSDAHRWRSRGPTCGWSRSSPRRSAPRAGLRTWRRSRPSFGPSPDARGES
jgi:uncharacterized RmlC-like cupin family protein